MLEILVAILGGVVLLGAVGIIALRKRRVAARLDNDEDARDVAPVLYVPQARNTFDAKRNVVEHRSDPVIAQHTISPAEIQGAPRPGARYIAPVMDVGTDSVLQLLPGRLVPAGSDVDQEIRFVRTPGVNKFTFGRSAGPANTHIQLLAATASRMHAYMVMDNGRWRIGNMSTTNQVLVNGVALDSGDEDRWLHDGDRIELGEVSFVFRER